MATSTPDCEAKTRKELFFASLTIAEATKRNYKTGLISSFFKDFLATKFKYHSLFEITDLDELFEIYNNVNIHPKNEEMHRVRSAAVMKYIRFLNGGKNTMERKNTSYHEYPKSAEENRRFKYLNIRSLL